MYKIESGFQDNALPKKRRVSYYSFYRKEQQEDLYRIVQAVGEYIVSNSIQNLLLVDRSARPLYLGVLNYLILKYPYLKYPKVYMLNPQGFLHNKGDYVDDKRWGNVDRNQLRSKELIIEDFKNTFHGLMANANKPTLLFDTCIHTGNSILPIKEILDEIGFVKVYIGSVTPHSENSKIQSDFYVSETHLSGKCYPLGSDERSLIKTYSSVKSVKKSTCGFSSDWSLLKHDIRGIIVEILEREMDSFSAAI